MFSFHSAFDRNSAASEECSGIFFQCQKYKIMPSYVGFYYGGVLADGAGCSGHRPIHSLTVRGGHLRSITQEEAYSGPWDAPSLAAQEL